ncbi:MAG: cell division protein FtsL [Gemmatimonadaceae bacterium]|nr:cell division protein FtsL [Gemmatimonadaceae bacterium]
MAKRSLSSGRLLIACGLVGFVLTAAAVVARRGYGHQQGVRTAALEGRQVALESERVRLEAAIRDASSRPRLGPIAEKRLGMRVPADSQVVILSRATRSGGTP